MGKKSYQGDNPRIPQAFKGIQINFCRTPMCENFGLGEEQFGEQHYNEQKLSSTATSTKRKNSHPYIISGVGKNESSLKCRACTDDKQNNPAKRQIFHQVKSNKAAYDEFMRLSSYLVQPESQCPNEDCPSNADGEMPSLIKKAGKTAAGTQRYRCGNCKKSWSEDRAEKSFNRPEINKQFFKQLISKTPLRRISFVQDLPMASLYRRLNFIHRQCIRFVAERELRLCEKQIKRMYLCSDSQVQISNWTDRKTKKNSEFYGIGTADLDSGYVLAFNFNYDAKARPEEIEADAIKRKDPLLKKHNRYHSRLWLQHEFREEVYGKGTLSQIPNWREMSESEIQDAVSALDTTSEHYTSDTQLPHKGMAVHNEYTMVAHFMLIRKLLSGVGKTRIYMDQDAGIRTWYLAAFSKEVKEKVSDAFHVRFDKGLTVDEKKKIHRVAVKKLEQAAGGKYNQLPYRAIKATAAAMMTPSIQSIASAQHLSECWIENPTPSMAEPNLEVLAVTDIKEMSLEHQAHLYQKGSLHAIDRFFAQLRRKLTAFERPISSGTNASRVWYGYSPYDPSLYQKLGDIFRVYYNYCQPYERDNKTPAMRLGLAKGIVSLEKILYFNNG